MFRKYGVGVPAEIFILQCRHTSRNNISQIRCRRISRNNYFAREEGRERGEGGLYIILQYCKILNVF